MNKTVNVQTDFSAKADGVTDDFPALQAALDSVKDGGTVYFPDGVYMISDCLVFYSHQTLEFSDNAVLRRMKLSRDEEPFELRYLLASYTENTPAYGGYNGTHDVVIRGGIFDGNEEVTEKNKITLLNTCHCKNITVTGCKFIHCAEWHMIEFNATEDSVIENCVFDGTTYLYSNPRNELVQLDAAKVGNYGPVFYPDGNEMEFVPDELECRNIEMKNNTFICDNFAAVGAHADFPHHHVYIHDNDFTGEPGYRGYITFMPSSHDIFVGENKYEFPDKITIKA